MVQKVIGIVNPEFVTKEARTGRPYTFDILYVKASERKHCQTIWIPYP